MEIQNKLDGGKLKIKKKKSKKNKKKITFIRKIHEIP